MNDVTRILAQIEKGEPRAAEQLLPLVYDELRLLAARQMAGEQPGQTLDATALVHEVYLRLVGQEQLENRRHFFFAAAQAMRRILIDRARARRALKRGGAGVRVDLDLDRLQARYSDAELIETDDLVDLLAEVDPQAAEIVRLHVFGGLPLEDAGNVLGISRATAYRDWAFARAWLRDALTSGGRSAG